MASKPANPAPAGGSSKKGLILGGGAALLLAIGGGVGYMLLGGKSEPPAEAAEGAEAAAGKGKAKAKAPIYHALDPAFIVNLADDGGARYLQVEVQVMAREQTVLDAIDTHMPVIRSQLLMLFSQHTSEELRSREAREALKQAVLEEIQRILTAEIGKPGIEAVYFTSFVTQ